MPSPFLLQLCLYSLCHFAAADWIGRPDKCHHSTSCGQLGDLGYPFSNISGPGCSMHQIKCGDSVPKLCGTSAKEPSYIVEHISYGGNWLRLIDDDFIASLETHQCDYERNFTLPPSRLLSFQRITPLVTFFKCEKSTPFPPGISFHPHCERHNLYYLSPDELDKIGLKSMLISSNKCHVFEFPLDQLPPEDRPEEEVDLVSLLRNGFLLEYDTTPNCSDCLAGKRQCEGNALQEFRCLFPPASPGAQHPTQKIIIGTVAGAGGLLVITCIIFILFRRKHPFSCAGELPSLGNEGTSVALRVEAFLDGHGALAPKRYRYSDLKKITNSFKNKLGQGGYGAVYQGKLADGRPVAVKLLSDSKGNGEEFMNEVACIGRTSHVNVVALLGFCSERSRRALVYEFMPNGSLEKFIYSGEANNPHTLGWEKLYQISVGIARGLEYLHRGCNTRILHFDIKPHNILLDADFCPKISDFGLAKLCPTRDSIISMTGARGTVGYIAPELVCRNFGPVSYKSDVYSFGMMVLEMVGGRKNLNALADKTSEIYFPHWIYKRLAVDDDLGLSGDVRAEEVVTAKKMLMVGLWCIQTDPEMRPSMSRVLEMMAGSLEEVQMPPKPFLSSPTRQ